jgi:prophage antirepressor-like protein
MKKSPPPALTRFRFEGGRNFTVLRWKGQPAWIAQEVCDFLGLKQAAPAIKAARLTKGLHFVVLKGRELEEFVRVSDSESLTNAGFSPKTRNLALVFESGLYSLIMRSRKPAAARFRDWVTREVLPALRRQGFYRMPGQVTAGDWRGVLTLFAQAETGDALAVAHLQRMGFTPEGDIPPAFRADPGPGIVARFIALARVQNRYAGNVLARGLGLPVPPDLQLSLPGVETRP